MCGIAGYIGEIHNPKEVLLKILKNLEYRGYDSAGVAYVQDNNIVYKKSVGELKNLIQLLKSEKARKGGLGIGHTRWATHGKPSVKNAHPHNVGDVFIVHNGIIENYKEIQDFLEQEGYKFKTDTDTEKVAGLFDYFLKQTKDPFEAFKSALKMLKGAYAIVAFTKEGDRIFASKLSSPLVLGVGEGEYFLASDALALSDFTKRVIYLQDGDILQIDKLGYKIDHINGNVSDRKIENLNELMSKAGKEGFDSYMLKEIYEQPQSIQTSTAGRISKELEPILGGLTAVEPELKSAKEIHFIAAGTSYNAALAVKHLFDELGLPVFVKLASEAKYDNEKIRENTIAFFISQSGETADTISALERYKKEGALTLGVVNTVASTIARETHAGVYNHAGPEISVASTKAFTSQLSVLFLIYSLLKKLKFTLSEKDKLLLKELLQTPKKLEDALPSIDKQSLKVAQKIFKKKSMFTLARGELYPIAKEAALKIKEISYIHAEAYPAGELKHGPIALIEKGFPTLYFVGNNLYEKTISNIQEVKARDAQVFSVCFDNMKEVIKISDNTIKIPKLKTAASLIFYASALQLIAYHSAKLKKLNVDKPRNLAKSVTVE